VLFQYPASEVYVHPERVKEERKRKKDPDHPLGVFDIAIVKLGKKVAFSDKANYLHSFFDRSALTNLT